MVMLEKKLHLHILKMMFCIKNIEKQQEQQGLAQVAVQPQQPMMDMGGMEL